MRIQTKRTLLRVASVVAIACATAVIFLPATASAAAATASAHNFLQSQINSHSPLGGFENFISSIRVR